MPPKALQNMPKQLWYSNRCFFHLLGYVVLFVAIQKWPEPAKLVLSNPKTKELKARNEVEKFEFYSIKYVHTYHSLA